MRVIRGRLDRTTTIAGVPVRLTPFGAPLPEVDAVLLEEDTYRLLSGEPFRLSRTGPLRQTIRDPEHFRPARPGSVLVRPGHPLLLLAIIHDLDLSPSWREHWIEAAVETALLIAEERRLRRLALPLLGTVHGRHSAERFLNLLRDKLAALRPAYPQRLWLMAERADLPALFEFLLEGAPGLAD